MHRHRRLLKTLDEERKERLHQLSAVVLAAAQVRESIDEHLVRFQARDDMALVFHHSAEKPAWEFGPESTLE